MESPNLSKGALEVLEDNGYSYRCKDGKIVIKKTAGIMGIIVLLFVTLFLSIPVFAAGLVYGLILIGAVVGGIFIRRMYFTDKMNLVIDLNNQTFSAMISTYHQEDQPLRMIERISMDSQFIDEYTTAARNSVEEHLVSIRIQLITKG